VRYPCILKRCTQPCYQARELRTVNGERVTRGSVDLGVGSWRLRACERRRGGGVEDDLPNARASRKRQPTLKAMNAIVLAPTPSKFSSDELRGREVGVGCEVKGLGCRVQGAGCRVREGYPCRRVALHRAEHGAHAAGVVTRGVRTSTFDVCTRESLES
jgi:hypothetical protein